MKPDQQSNPEDNRPPQIVEITILGKSYKVEEDYLLWIFQKLGMVRFYSQFCWNAECNNCPVTFRPDLNEPEQTKKACRTMARSGLVVTAMPEEFYKVP
jgi:hypothetical protein